MTTLNLSSIQAVLSDMDGVLWRGSAILPGVPDFFIYLRERGIAYALLTNNSSKTQSEYVERIKKLGIPIEPEQIITSGLVTIDEMLLTYPQGTPIYLIGSQSLRNNIEAAGYRYSETEAKAVIVGRDEGLSWAKIVTATRLIMGGADFIGTNGDLTFPTADGIEPGNGAILASIQAATGITPRLMGKPAPAMYHSALKRLGTTPDQTLMIGDRLDTDIVGAKLVGLRAALVLSGVTRAEEVDHSDPCAPDALYADLAAMLNSWKSGDYSG